MFKTLKQLFTKKNKDIRKRVYFTLAVLTLFVVGTTIEVPGTQEITKSLGFLELLYVMGGGALSNFSIFALGVTPYITASIVMQLLQMDIVPYFADLAKQGHAGRQKINKITRYLGIFFAFIQGFAMAYAFLGSSVTMLQRLEVAFIMTAGTAFLLWLGDQVTQKGIGNGVSLIIMAGIVSSLPGMMITAFKELVDFSTTNTLISGGATFLLFLIICFLVIVAVIFVEGAARRISIQYANKSTANLGKQSYMPIKINSAGVIPVIFASSLLAVFSVVAQFSKSDKVVNFINNYLDYTTPVGLIIYVVLIIFFTYFYTFVQMKPDQMAENLQKNGGYVPGIRPGNDTEKYFVTVLKRLTTVGALFLAAIAAFPIILNMCTGLPRTVSIGGTSLLIVVGVAIETYKQLESSLLSREYSPNKRTNSKRARR